MSDPLESLDDFTLDLLACYAQMHMRAEFEELLARNRIALVSHATAREIDRIEKLNYNVPLSELQDVLYAIHASSTYGDYWPAKVFA